jgi:hypothetical protein
VLGFANLFSNPINFLRTLNFGIRDFVSTPTRSVHQVHITFFEPIAFLWLWHSCMANLVGVAHSVWSCYIVCTQQFHISNQILIIEPRCFKMIWKWNFHDMVCVAMFLFLYKIWRFVLIWVHSNVGNVNQNQNFVEHNLCWH